MKVPKFLSKLSAVLTPRPQKKLKATARAARQTMEDYDEEEPTTKLSSAFIVVLILHVILVGGIYAFNSIKASRRDREEAAKAAEPAAAVTAKTVPQAATPAAPLSVNNAAAVRKEPAALAPAPAAASARAAAGRQYEVKPGDNLTRIAFAYSVSSADLMAANQLKDDTVLHPGQSLIIPAARTAAKPGADTPRTAATPKSADVPATKTTPGAYTVKKGDTLTSIARSLGQSVDELTKANKTVDPKKLQPGQVLKVPPRKS